MSERVVKVGLPVDLIRRMDQALAEERGGLGTRAEFLREAAESFLAEISYPAAPPEPDGGGPESKPVALAAEEAEVTGGLAPELLKAIPPWEREELRLSDLTGTALPPVRPGEALDSGVADPGH